MFSRAVLLPLITMFLVREFIDKKNQQFCICDSKFEELVDYRFFESPETFNDRNHRSLADTPLGLVNQSREEESYLKFHKCRDAGEAYSASYLITKEHLINQFTGLDLLRVNCEMGSFIMMNEKAHPDRNVNGSIIQTLDVFDFSVVHLSWYERLQKRYARQMQIDLKIARSDKKRLLELHSTVAIEDSIEFLKSRALKQRDSNYLFPVPELNRTIAVMPFLASDMGAGHSKLWNRLNYLAACFWSVYTEMPHVVVVVMNAADAHYAMNISGLPFYDVILLTDLPKSASLPVATVQQSKARIMDGRWDFDYLYFTESDQILVMRLHEEIYNHLKKYPRRLIVPHRLTPYPSDVALHVHKKPFKTNNPMDWLDMTCCLQRQNCKDRKDWVKIGDTRMKLVNIFGLQVALGNSDFHAETYRYCTLNDLGDQPYCP